MGDDPLTGKNFDHRKAWMEDELQRLAACFGIDLLTFAILSNHFHLILRSRPDVVQAWSDEEVARRWLMLCPYRKDEEGRAKDPKESEISSIAKDSKRLTEIRSRLSDISWWMRLLSQSIAQRANRDDKEVGKFWQARFKAVRLLDETAVLACSAYVDLNPIRAAIAETVEGSDYTSVQRRALSQRVRAKSKVVKSTAGDDSQAKAESSKPASQSKSDAMLAPITIDELHDAIGAVPSKSSSRASDKGYLPMTLASYLDLLNFTAHQVRVVKQSQSRKGHSKRGQSEHDKPKRVQPPSAADSVFRRLGISQEVWLELVNRFDQLFYTVAGKPESVDARRTRDGTHRHKAKLHARQLLKA